MIARCCLLLALVSAYGWRSSPTGSAGVRHVCSPRWSSTTENQNTAAAADKPPTAIKLVEEFTLSNFGVFDEAVVSLRSEPVFACITGETASGKSVLISALQHLCAATPSSSASGSSRGVFSANGDAGSASEIELLIDGNRYKRSFVDPASSAAATAAAAKAARSSCEINGKRSAAKTLAALLKQDIRFWTTESIYMLGSGPDGFMHYVDTNLCARGATVVLPETERVYTAWARAHEELQRLTQLERRRDRGNEGELLGHFVDELTTFEGKLAAALADCAATVGDVIEAVGSGAGPPGAEGAAGGVPSVLERLAEQLRPYEVRGRGAAPEAAAAATAAALAQAQTWPTLVLAVQVRPYLRPYLRPLEAPT
jgi:hypothetical protein